jgi:hypothetical protein
MTNYDAWRTQSPYEETPAERQQFEETERRQAVLSSVNVKGKIDALADYEMLHLHLTASDGDNPEWEWANALAKLFVVLSERVEVVEVDGKRWRVRCEEITNQAKGT